MHDDARYVVSTGGDYDSALGKSVPGFSIYHFGLDLVAVVSTGDDVWELKVDTNTQYDKLWSCQRNFAKLSRNIYESVTFPNMMKIL